MSCEQYRALIVEDEQFVRELTVRAMTQEDFICDEAVDGEEAIAKCDREDYDLVVTNPKTV